MSVQESIVAIDTQSRYPGGRGGKIMSSEDNSQGPEAKKNGDTEARKVDDEKKKAKGKTVDKKEKPSKEKKEDFEKELEITEKELKKAKEAGSAGSVKFGDAREAIEVIDAMQDEHEVVLSEQDVKDFQNLLISKGHMSEKVVGKMTTAQLVVAVQTVLRYVDIEEPTETDIYSQSKQELDLMIKKVRSFDEETLTVEKVSKYVDPDSYEPVLPGMARASRAGVGTPPIPDPITPLLPMTGDLGIFQRDMLRAIDPAREVGVSLDRLRQIEQDLDKAVRETRLKDALHVPLVDPDTNADVVIVRDALRQGIENLEKQYGSEVNKQRGEVNFDEQFGKDYHDAKALIEAGGAATAAGAAARAELRGLLESLRLMSEDYILNWHQLAPTVIGVDFDVTDEETWPSVGEEDITRLFEVTRAISQVAALPGGRERLRGLIAVGGVVTAGDRNLIEQFTSKDRNINLLQRVDRFYDNVFSNMDDNGRKSVAGDIEENAATARATIVSGLSPFDRRMKDLFDVVNRRTGFSEARQALRKWRGLFTIDGIEKSVDYYQLTQPPSNWKDAPAKIYKLINNLEPSGLSPQDLGPIIQQAYGILNFIEQDTDHGRGMFRELRGALEAFKLRQTIAITMHLESQNPETLQRVFKEINGDLEESFTKWIARFARDTNGRRWYRTENFGGPNETHHELNMIDPSKKLYSEQVRTDRIKMNMIEEMTKIDSIANPFNPAAIRRISSAVAYENLPDHWQQPIVNNAEFVRRYARFGLNNATWRNRSEWELELEVTRQWLQDRLVYHVNEGTNVDYYDQEGVKKHRDAELDDWATEPDLRRGVTKKIVQDWYDRKSLLGAFGLVDEMGFDEIAGYRDATTGTFIKGELADTYRKEIDDPVTGGRRLERDEEVGERIRGMHELGLATWLDVRRHEMRQRLRNELRDMHLKYDTNVKFGEKGISGNLRLVDEEGLDKLLESGYIGSVDANAYDISWLFEWSTNNLIHIYGTGKDKYGDDYKAIVQSKSSDLYFASMVDHNQEFLHPDFEDRGRGREDDVNDYFRQHMIGKHQWFAPQFSMATRFIESFCKDDRDLIDERTEKLRHENPYMENERYAASYEDQLRGVAKRELIIEGAISFADRPFTEVVAERGSFNKFNPIDSAADRNLLLKFMSADMIQKYLGAPTAESFHKITTKEGGFVSTRDPRLFPAMEMFLRGHWDVVHNLKFKMFDEPDITMHEMENFTENLVAEGFMEIEAGEQFKRTVLHRGKIPILGAISNYFTDVWQDERKLNQAERRHGLLRFLWSLLTTLIGSSFTAAGKEIGEDLKKQR